MKIGQINVVLLFIVFSVICDSTQVKNQCKAPLKSEAFNILKTLGFSATCATAALELCDKQCEYDFYQLFSSIKNSFDSFETSFKTAKLDLETLLSCVVPITPEGQTPGGRTRKVSKHQNCEEVRQAGSVESGVEIIYPFECCPDKGIEVYCEQTVGQGGWTVIQRRASLPVREQFYRVWSDYVNGFGNLTGEFWLGLDVIHALTAAKTNELRVELEDTKGGKRFAKYTAFNVAGGEESYRLDIDGYSGDAGDSMSSHNGFKFSTFDKDNDNYPQNCAQLFKGAWWYNKCHESNLNGFPFVGKLEAANRAQGVHWNPFHGHLYSLPKVSMMIRPTKGA